MEKKRILHILGSLSFGGIESMLLNFQKVIDKEKFQMDYVTCSTEVSEMEQALLKEGAVVFHITRRKTNIFKHLAEFSRLLKENRDVYDIVHVHMNNEAYLPLILLKCYGYKIRIAHSHTSYIGRELDIISRFKCSLTRVFSNQYAACSISAAKFLFGEKNLSKVHIIHNCISYDDYMFDMDKRNKIRDKYAKDYKIVVGYVSRLDVGKNHEYICKLAQRETMKHCLFWLVGEGSEYTHIEKLIDDYNVTDNVKLLGKRNDVANLLNAMDVFVMPSEHEGFPMVLVEAQVNGLQCIVSKYVSEEINLSNKVVFLDITDKNLKEWEDNILQSPKVNRKMECSKAYDAEYYIKELEDYYLQLLKEEK